MPDNELPFSEACERNKVPILAALREWLVTPGLVLEIGSGTGQHAVFFARALPHLRWQPTELPEAMQMLRPRLDANASKNLLPPLALDVAEPQWQPAQADAVFSANTAHIMSWKSVCCMFAGVGRLLPSGGQFCLYGPFIYEGQYTSASNARFDAMLRARDRLSGLRDIADLDSEAASGGLIRVADLAMPANNRLQAWLKQ